jgi:hypothetical protein
MKPYVVLKTLAMWAEELTVSESPGGSTDMATRVLVAASLELLKMIKAELDANDFDFDDLSHQQSLMWAVWKLNPDAELDDEELASARLIQSMIDSGRY